MRGVNYILDDNRKPVAVDTSTMSGILRWGQFMQMNNRRVARDVLCGGVFVSTVFLGMDHGWTANKPVLFETMVFGGKFDEEMHRFCTWEEAQRAHQQVVARVRYVEGSRGYSRSHWRKIRRSVLMAHVTNVIPFPRAQQNREFESASP